MTPRKLEELNNLHKRVTVTDVALESAHKLQNKRRASPSTPCYIDIDGTRAIIPHHIVDGIINQIVLRRVFEARDAARQFKEAQ